MRKPNAETVRALELVAEGMSPYSAALAVGIQPSSVYSAVQRARLRELEVRQPKCPTCGGRVSRYGKAKR